MWLVTLKKTRPDSVIANSLYSLETCVETMLQQRHVLGNHEAHLA